MRRPIVPVRFIPLIVGTLALALVALAGPVRAAGPAVIVLPTTGEVDGVMAQYLADGIARRSARVRRRSSSSSIRRAAAWMRPRRSRARSWRRPCR